MNIKILLTDEMATQTEVFRTNELFSCAKHFFQGCSTNQVRKERARERKEGKTNEAQKKNICKSE